MITSSQDSEIEALRRRIDELEALRLSAERARDESEQRFRLFTQVTHETVAIFDGPTIVDVSAEFEVMFRGTMADIIGRNAFDFAPASSHPILVHNLRSGSEKPYEAELLRLDGTTFIARVRGKAISYQGRPMRLTAFLDITEEKEAEKALRAAAVQEQVIAAQAEMIAALSTPLLPISARVVALPLIGQVNEGRAAQVVEALSRGVFERRASIAILDITGATEPLASVAEMLTRAARVIGMLGAELVLTGIRPEVAAALVRLGIDLGDITTRATLQQAVSYALGR